MFVNSTVKSLFFIQGFYQVKVIQAGLTSWPLGMSFSLQVNELSYFHTWKMNTWKNLRRRMHRGYPKPRQRGEFTPFHRDCLNSLNRSNMAQCASSGRGCIWVSEFQSLNKFFQSLILLHLCLRLYVKLHVTLTLATWNTYAFNAEK